MDSAISTFTGDISNGNKGNKELKQNRSIIVDAYAFGSLRKDLIGNIGMERTKGFLFRYGWNLGVQDAKECKNRNIYNSLNELIEYGPVLHSMKGYVTSKTLKLEIQKEDKVLDLVMESVWENSYEADEHLQQIGKSTSPVCYTLAGYASGFVSESSGEMVIFKEKCCRAAGASECFAVGKTVRLWGDEIKEELYYLQETPILEELEYTYEKLLQERNNLAYTTNIHKKLTEEVIKGNSLNSIIQEVYELTNIPIMVHTVQGQSITYAGFSSLPSDFHIDDLLSFLSVKVTNHVFPQLTRTTLYHYDPYLLLTSPIYIQEKLTGYCTFIYLNPNEYKKEISNMIIERVSSVCSLCLLYEKTKLDSFERMKGFFFNEILSGHYATNAEIIAKANLIQLDLSLSYYLGTVEYSFNQNDFINELELHKELMEAISQYCNEQNRHFLIGQNGKNINILVTECDQTQKNKPFFFDELYTFLDRKFPNSDIYIGVSRKTELIQEAPGAYKEANIAIRLVSKNKRIISFEDLGVVGSLINKNNMKEVRLMAETVLGKLQMNDTKNVELIHTLYTFLLYGGNLEKTAEELTLSISGLRYRINKIEELLQKDIRSPIISYQLLISIQALIILGELDFKAPAV